MTRKEFVRSKAVNLEAMHDAAFAIDGLEEYRYRFYDDPSMNWPEAEFDTRCAAIWAINEVIDRIKTRPYIDPTIISEQFLFELLECMRNTESNHMEQVFRVASNVVEEIIDLMHSMF